MSCGCYSTRSLTRVGAALLAFAGASFPATVAADPASKVYSPIVEYGETELEFRAGRLEDNDGNGDGEQQYVFAIGRGIMPRWFTELVVAYETAPGESLEVDEVEWENVFQLTERGQYFVDLGLFVEYAHKPDADQADKVEIGPLIQYELGLAQFNLNPLFEREVGDGAERVTELSYGFQMKWRGNPLFEPGLQAFGELGEWNDWAGRNSQEHNLGPAFFGKIKYDQCAFKYAAGWLFGLTRATPDNTLKLELELEFW